MTDNLSVPRREVQHILRQLREAASNLQEILDRPAPPSRGRIAFRDGEIDLPDEPYDPRD
ncbi:MAG TPA: hypothetical protein VIQ30_22485 [Pseudonocardia sp.]